MDVWRAPARFIRILILESESDNLFITIFFFVIIFFLFCLYNELFGKIKNM